MEPFLVIFTLISYLVGSFPTGVVLTKLSGGADIRREGSGNIGATNVTRVAGKKLGALTLAGDLLKGFLPVFIGGQLLQPAVSLMELRFAVCLFGLAAFLGHLYPVYLKFKGGKGVATACGVFLCLEPAVIPIELLLFVAVAAIWRYVSIASLAAAAAMPFALMGLSYIKVVSLPALLLSIVTAVFIFVRHRDNIRRLLRGTEDKIGAPG